MRNGGRKRLQNRYGGALLETATSLPLVLLAVIGAFDLCSISSHYFLTNQALNSTARNLAVTGNVSTVINASADPAGTESLRSTIQERGSAIFRGLRITTFSAVTEVQTVTPEGGTAISRPFMRVSIEGDMVCVTCRVITFGQMGNLSFRRTISIPLENQS